MKRKIFLHIGFGKTGTTSIQKTLLENRYALLNKGVLYPSTGIVDGAHRGLFPLNHNELDVGIFSELISEIEKSESEKVVLSSENMSFLNESYVEKISGCFENFDVRVIFYVRNQVSLIESSFLQ
jgi:hypothetical protein